MIKFFYHPSPNPLKVALFLEETQLPYELVPVDTRKGEQHDPGFLSINPNGKTPAILDGDIPVFDSNAILLYLAAKHEAFLPIQDDSHKAQIASWLMFVASGISSSDFILRVCATKKTCIFKSRHVTANLSVKSFCASSDSSLMLDSFIKLSITKTSTPKICLP